MVKKKDVPLVPEGDPVIEIVIPGNEVVRDVYKGLQIGFVMDESLQKAASFPGAAYLVVWESDGQGNFIKQDPLKLPKYPPEEIIFDDDGVRPRDKAKFKRWLTKAEKLFGPVEILFCRDFFESEATEDIFFRRRPDRLIGKLHIFPGAEFPEMPAFLKQAAETYLNQEKIHMLADAAEQSLIQALPVLSDDDPALAFLDDLKAGGRNAKNILESMFSSKEDQWIKMIFSKAFPDWLPAALAEDGFRHLTEKMPSGESHIFIQRT
ncbi:MAG: hypothetical protein LBK52_07885 [Deltaproteobacteria bacterium]|jgi:hypothetical protein|nr:hypothetical protein [Deltaproteobacteria bacterium]